ncbi:TipAS antibiotic-recognition domain-containing protein [Bacillus marinisedimentorum]|uniref:TipAS antibiotic-recognition domain-containing protein n=1 Tax=Bacillus marinisedimentorum TaxID=1821260 RepID=UPI0007E1EE8D|nr:TipAS antibiotic-recognition domain-containing protein [Bacillus marinisedimentorum]
MGKYQKVISPDQKKIKVLQQIDSSLYDSEDWQVVHREGSKICRKLDNVLHLHPHSADVQNVVGQFRQHIADHFYNCPPDVFRSLADVFVNDPRFLESIVTFQPELPNFLWEAIHFYADEMEKG